jgi:hypothetical protein
MFIVICYVFGLPSFSSYSTENYYMYIYLQIMSSDEDSDEQTKAMRNPYRYRVVVSHPDTIYYPWTRTSYISK